MVESEVDRSETLFLGYRKGVGKQLIQPPFYFNIVKTKHLQKKAEKRKLTRSLKHKKVSEARDIKSMLLRRLDHIVTDVIKNNAKDGKQVSEMKEYRSKIRQVLS